MNYAQRRQYLLAIKITFWVENTAPGRQTVTARWAFADRTYF